MSQKWLVGITCLEQNGNGLDCRQQFPLVDISLCSIQFVNRYARLDQLAYNCYLIDGCSTGCLRGAAADVSDAEGRLPCGVRCGGVWTARRRSG